MTRILKNEIEYDRIENNGIEWVQYNNKYWNGLLLLLFTQNIYISYSVDMYTLTSVKKKKRNKLNYAPDLHVTLTSCVPCWINL